MGGPLFTPIRRTAGRLELRHFPASYVFFGFFTLLIVLSMIAFSFVQLQGDKNPPEFLRWLLRLVGGFLLWTYISNLVTEKRVSYLEIDLISKRMAILRRPCISLKGGPQGCDREEYSLDGISKVVLRKTTVTISHVNHSERRNHRSLRLVKNKGEDISLFGRDYTTPIWGGKPIGQEIADFLGVEFAVETIQ